jgi:hypothetical protein
LVLLTPGNRASSAREVRRQQAQEEEAREVRRQQVQEEEAREVRRQQAQEEEAREVLLCPRAAAQEVPAARTTPAGSENHETRAMQGKPSKAAGQPEAVDRSVWTAAAFRVKSRNV